jgi:outer membrane protein assembly factor BamB
MKGSPPPLPSPYEGEGDKERLRRVFTLTVAAALLSGCSTIGGWFGSDEVAEPPAPLVDFQPTLQVRTRWSVDAGRGGTDEAASIRAAVAGGRVAITDARGTVQLLEADTGARVWETGTGVAATAGPTVGEGLVVIGSQDGQVVALDAAGGAVRWQTTVSSEVLSPPAIGRGVVAVRAGDGRLFGLDAQSGRRLWVFDRPVPILSLRGTGTPVIVGEGVIAGFDGGQLAAVLLQDGRGAWEVQIGNPRGRSELERVADMDTTPVVAQGTVYAVAHRGVLAALDLPSGRPQWQREMSSTSGVAVDADAVYATDESGHVWALDRATGRGLWKNVRLQARGLTAPAVVGRYVVVGDRQGYLHWLRREDGEFAARERVDSDGLYPLLTVAGDTLYVVGRSGVIAALQPGG